jgi:DNA-binding CsgD family transcriptional regulator
LPDPETAAARLSEGRELGPDEAIALALATRLPDVRTPSPSGLSQREIDVLRLLAQGHTDREIAAMLFVSRRTASTHVRHIYDKLNVSSRVAATAWALRHGLA